MNQIILHGRLGRDPEITEKQGPNGPFKVGTFNFAVDRDYGDKTDWFRCEIIGKGAEVLQSYVKKGRPLIVIGRMESYKTDRDEFVHWKVIVNKFYFEKNKDNASMNGSATSTEASTEKDSFEQIDVDVPF